MDRRMRPATALRALLATLALVLGGLSPTAAAATPPPHADGAPYATTYPAGPPHAHDGSAHSAQLHAVLRTAGRSAPAEQHVAHPVPGLGPVGRFAPRLPALARPPARGGPADRQQCCVGLRPARAPPLSSR
ncbi:hypothetical protein [Streptomyces niger]|uniref:hypothetical protein n=1 Tax=Streptomyces niger TaxID=66373 RepID=UPI00069BF64E|nr:hypothetical protein [Streptomyces niger]